MSLQAAPRDNLQAPAGDDSVRPFTVPALDVRGRAVQMGPELDALLKRHNYPTPVSRLLGEAIVLTALLGTSLKFDGRFTLQTDTDGAVDMLVVDYRTSGTLRAYARFDEERVAAAVSSGVANAGPLLGDGTMAMTIDQGSHTNRYQGIVALQGASLEDVAHAYFDQSEQIPTRVRLAVAEMQQRTSQGLVSSWRAGGILVQFLPRSPERARQRDLSGGDVPDGSVPLPVDEDEAWTEARALTETVEDIELTDPDVPVERLLFRLFNERGVRVLETAPLREACSCSREKVAGVLSGFSTADIRHSSEDGAITVRCEFCNRSYGFDPAQIEPSDGEGTS
ncbi:MAG: Hsp33 family molecular chaperone [Alphaproteobacteria bacterium]